MARSTARKKPRSSEARRAAEVREHYRRFRVERQDGDGRTYWYNTLLDDPQHPDNIRHWTHATAAGSIQAGCGCPPCLQAGRVENKRKERQRLDKRLADHRERVAAILRAQLHDLPPETVEHGAEHVTAAHRVVNHHKATVVYDEHPLKLALGEWARAESVTLDPEQRDALAATIAAELAP